MASKPKYFTIEFNGEEMVVFYPQYKDDDEWVIVSKEKPFPVELTEHNNSEITDLLKSIQKSQEETKEQSELLAELISEMEKLATGPQGEPFRYEDFTEEQLEGLRGPKGDPFEFDDFTDEQLESFTNAAKEEVSEEIVDHTESTDNPHQVTKNQVGLGSVINERQATRQEFNAHIDSGKHITESDDGDSYIRFDDGTQICFSKGELTYANNTSLRKNFKFSMPFSSTPSVSYALNVYTSNIQVPSTTITSRIANPSRDSVDIILNRIAGLGYGDFEEGDYSEAHVTAIGRWK